MAQREKILLTVMAVMLFCIVNLIAYTKLYEPRLKKALAAEKTAEKQLIERRADLAAREEMEGSIAWLARCEGKPQNYQDAQADLQKLMKQQAKNQGLEMIKEAILDWSQGSYYDRVRVSNRVKGKEDAIQRWILSLHQPEKLQVATRISVKPQASDLTQVECTVEVEKYFVPALEDEEEDLTPEEGL